MTLTDHESLVRRYAQPVAEGLGLGIWGIEVTGGSRQLVRVFVEALPQAGSPAPGDQGLTGQAGGPGQGGVSVEQCAELSRALGLALEVDDVFSGAWTLEVSSPGFERPFFEPAQMPPYIGREVEATLAAPLAAWPGRKKFRGLLRDVSDDAFTLTLDATQRRPDEPELAVLPWSHVRKAHLVHIFVEPEKPGKGKTARNKPGAASEGIPHPAEHQGGEAGE